LKECLNEGFLFFKYVFLSFNNTYYSLSLGEELWPFLFVNKTKL